MKFKLVGLQRIHLNEDDWWKDSQKKIAKMLEQEHKEIWAREESPWTGEKWKELTPLYKEVKDKTFPGQPILRATGKMQDKMKIVANEDGTFNVQTTKYGAAHQFGTDKLPQRSWVGIPEVAIPKIEDIILGKIFKRSKK